MNDNTTHILFVCSQNIQRSPTAEDMVNRDLSDRYIAKSAGIDPLAEVQSTQHHIEWADIIIVMEAMHRAWIEENFERGDTPIHVLDIPDRYVRDEPALRERLADVVPPILDSDGTDYA